MNYEILDQHFDVLELSYRAINTLRTIRMYTRQFPTDQHYPNPFETVRDVCRLKEWHLLRMKNCGRLTVNEIKAVLAEHGLRLNAEYPVYSVDAYWGA